MFLVRLAFWITVVAVLLPAPDTPDARSAGRDNGTIPAAMFGPSSGQSLDMTEVAGAAMASAEDVLGFCDRNPTACDTGLAIAGHVQRQVFYYGGLALSWAAEQGSNASMTRSSHTSAKADPREPMEVFSPSTSTSSLRGA
ncbi:MAG: hypothetical protein COA62_11340 [Rhodobiaceae bacterium]|nr:MAG: hypothetical protein COA62_11340 [Rhodobiaceae bacterium]